MINRDGRTDYERLIDLLNEMGVHMAERSFGFRELFVAPAAERPVFIFEPETGKFLGVVDRGLPNKGGTVFTAQRQEKTTPRYAEVQDGDVNDS